MNEIGHYMEACSRLREENEELRKVVDAACVVVDNLAHLYSSEDIALAEAVANYRAYSGPLVRA